MNGAGNSFEKMIQQTAGLSASMQRIMDDVESVAEKADYIVHARSGDFSMMATVIAMAMDLREQIGTDVSAQAILAVYLMGFSDGIKKGKQDASNT